MDDKTVARELYLVRELFRHSYVLGRIYKFEDRSHVSLPQGVTEFFKKAAEEYEPGSVSLLRSRRVWRHKLASPLSLELVRFRYLGGASNWCRVVISEVPFWIHRRQAVLTPNGPIRSWLYGEETNLTEGCAALRATPRVCEAEQSAAWTWRRSDETIGGMLEGFTYSGTANTGPDKRKIKTDWEVLSEQASCVHGNGGGVESSENRMET